MTEGSFLLTDIGELITLAPLAERQNAAAVTSKDLGRLTQAWLAVEDGKVVAFGQGVPPSKYQRLPHQDAKGGVVMPGLVDSHTHPVFAGNRSHEFCQRLEGATYQQIATAGGGIRYTVKQTRAASAMELTQSAVTRLRHMLQLGTTTVECKSGYGLTVEAELRLLRALKAAEKFTPQTLRITCLALHAYLAEDGLDRSAFLRTMTDDLLPMVAEEKLAHACDAFIEQGYFSFAEAKPYLAKAQSLGLALRIHADEFADSGTAAAIANLGAQSADHLEHANDEGIAAMAAAGTTAILLPGTSLYTRLPYTDARRFIKHGCAVALATDFNPGSCVLNNLAQVATLGALNCHLTLPEAVAAVTYAPACSLALGNRKGALAPGFDADILHYDSMQRVEDWLADFGRHQPTQVWVAGNSASSF